MSQYAHFADEIRTANPSISNALLGVEVKAMIAQKHPAPTPYDLHGLPDPSGIIITDEIRNKAFEIVDHGAPNLLIQYVRSRPPIVTRVIVEAGTGATTKKMKRGEPIGVMVAFIDNKELLAGYSKYNFATVKSGDGETVMIKGKPEQLEKLVFTKKDAINTAVLRALTDNIDDDSTPFKIAMSLPAFLERAEKYFKNAVSNKVAAVSVA